MEAENRSGGLMAKCPHGLYGDGWGCQLCHPPGWNDDDAPSPVLPRSSADPLNADKSSKIDTCPFCGMVRTYSLDKCPVCDATLPQVSERSRAQGTANAHQSGACSDCGSTIHYATGKASEWECSDCGATYKSTKRK